MKNKTPDYLEKIPVRRDGINWTCAENGTVTLEIENKGLFDKIAQKLLKRPKISYIRLEEIGSFVWPIIDGAKNITEIGVMVQEHFAEKAEPLYPRLSKYFQILKSCNLITFK